MGGVGEGGIHLPAYHYDRLVEVYNKRLDRWELEHLEDLIATVPLATLFVYFIDHIWPQKAVLWLRRLGGKLGLSFDPDGPYILLAGISAVLVAVSAITFALRHPFPKAG